MEFSRSFHASVSASSGVVHNKTVLMSDVLKMVYNRSLDIKSPMEPLVPDLVWEVMRHLPPHHRYNLARCKREYYDKYLKIEPRITLGDSPLNLDQALLVDRLERSEEHLITVHLPPCFGRTLVVFLLALRCDKETLLLVSSWRKRQLEETLRTCPMTCIQQDCLRRNLRIVIFEEVLRSHITRFAQMIVLEDPGVTKDIIDRTSKIIIFDPAKDYEKLVFSPQKSLNIELPFDSLPAYLPRHTWNDIKLQSRRGLSLCDELHQGLSRHFLTTHPICIYSKMTFTPLERKYLKSLWEGVVTYRQYRRDRPIVDDRDAVYVLLGSDKIKPTKLYKLVCQLLRRGVTNLLLGYDDPWRNDYRRYSFELYENNQIPLLDDNPRMQLRVERAWKRSKEKIIGDAWEFMRMCRPDDRRVLEGAEKNKIKK